MCISAVFPWIAKIEDVFGWGSRGCGTIVVGYMSNLKLKKSKTSDQTMKTEELKKTVSMMMQTGKGILAADESNNSAAKRLSSINVENTEENRRLYRELFLGAKGIEQYLSGVILYDETIRQKNNEGVPYAEALTKLGIVPGIKVDMGAKDFPGFPGEKVTEGLDGLRDRLKEYYNLGARFAKWRSVIAIGDSGSVRTTLPRRRYCPNG